MSSLGARVSLAWVRAYTRGASSEAAARRADEIASDVWEHESHERAAGRSRLAADTAIILRCLRGVPSDLSWRFDHRANGGITLMHTIQRNALVIVSALLAALYFFIGVGVHFGEDVSPWWSVAAFVAGAVVLVGVWLIRRSPWLGCVVLGTGALPLAAVTVWAIFPPILALLAVGLAVARARTLTRGPSGLPT